MTTKVWDAQYQQNSDAEFRLWGDAIHDALVDIGLTQTSDTGQINWTTVTAPVAATTSQGYEIWRFNDSMQSTTPIYIKFEFGSGSTNATRPNVWTTIGTSTDGAGNITGTTWAARSALNTTTNGSSTSSRNYACYNTDTGTFFMCFGAGNGSAFSGSVLISRAVDEDGVPDSEVVMAFRQTSVNTTGTWTGYRGDLASTISSPDGGWSYPLSTWTNFGDGVYLPVFICYSAGQKLRPMTGYFGMSSFDFASGSQINIEYPVGTTRNYIYLPTGSAGSPSGSATNGSSSSKFFLIWE